VFEIRPRPKNSGMTSHSRVQWRESIMVQRMIIGPSVLVLYREKSKAKKELRRGSGEEQNRGPEPYPTMDKKKPLREAPP
jgi:hypothetical protein